MTGTRKRLDIKSEPTTARGRSCSLGLPGRAVASLAVTLGKDGAPPTEFRLFKAGWNDTEKGPFLYDAEAEALTLEAYKTWGVEIAIDLEHQMLEEDTPPEPTAKDARGWLQLEPRDGELWAVNVSWTPDGDQRLRERRQRYVSPAFTYDEELRVTSLYNVAITATPATRGATALMAASARFKDLRTLSSGPSFSDVSKAIGEALRERFPNVYPYTLDVFDSTAVYEADGKLFEVAYVFDGAVVTLGEAVTEVKRSYSPVPVSQPPARLAARTTKGPLMANSAVMPPALAKSALDIVAKGDKNGALALVSQLLESFLTGGQAADPPAADPPADPPAEPAMAAASVKALLALLASAKGKASASASTADDDGDDEEGEAALAAAIQATEDKERCQCGADLVKLAHRLPAEVWADPATKTLKSYLASMPLASLKEYVADAVASAKGRPPPGPPVPPEGGGADGLSARILAKCKAKGIDPALVAETRATIRARSQRA